METKQESQLNEIHLRELADVFHASFCPHNHINECRFYFEREWIGVERKKWMKVARDFIVSGKNLLKELI